MHFRITTGHGAWANGPRATIHQLSKSFQGCNPPLLAYPLRIDSPLLTFVAQSAFLCTEQDRVKTLLAAGREASRARLGDRRPGIAGSAVW